MTGRRDQQARTSAWLAAGAIGAFAVCAQLRILDVATMTVIFAGWAFGAAWLIGGAGGRARWRARLIRIAVRSAETVGSLDPEGRHDHRLRVPLDELLGGPCPGRLPAPADARAGTPYPGALPAGGDLE